MENIVTATTTSFPSGATPDPMGFRVNVNSPFRSASSSTGIPGAKLYQFANRQPSWISRTALLVFGVIIVLPIVALIFLAFCVGFLIFGSLAFVNSMWTSLTNGFRLGKANRKGGLPRTGKSKRRDSDGRSNVTVIDR